MLMIHEHFEPSYEHWKAMAGLVQDYIPYLSSCKPYQNSCSTASIQTACNLVSVVLNKKTQTR